MFGGVVMGIDRIGKAGGPAVPGPVVPVTGAGRAGEPFAVREGAAVGAPTGVASSPLGPLEQLRSGAIDLAQYVELKVTEATSHLAALPATELETIRASLRERLASDPSLVELRDVVARGAGVAAQLGPNDPKE